MIFITGGLGYLGGRIASHLIESQHDVRLGVRRDDYILPGSLESAEVRLINMQDTETLVASTAGVDTIIHLASPNSKRCELNKVEALQVNGIGALNIVEAAEVNDVKKIIYFSTAHIYGKNLKGFVDETVLPIPYSSYAITHLLAENYFLSECSKKNIDCTILRLSNSFGRPESSDVDCWSLVINDFCRQSFQNGKIELTSDGTQYRDFIAIESVCDIVNFFIDKPDNTEPDVYPVYNVGGKNPRSVINIANIIAERFEEMFGNSIDVIPGHSVERDVVKDDLIYSVSKLENLGFELVDKFNKELDGQLIFSKKMWG